jgi:DNA-binding PadR family transcriptional regulator
MKLLSHRDASILAILSGRERYGLDLRRTYEREYSESFPVGSLYVVLGRLKAGGLVESRLGKSAHVHGGNHRKYFKLTAKGRDALLHYQERAWTTMNIRIASSLASGDHPVSAGS